MRKAIIFLTFIANVALAQDSTKFCSSYQLTGSLSGGNVNRQLFSTSETFNLKLGKTTLATNPSFTYGTKGTGATVAETEYFQTISVSQHISDKSKLMGFVDLDHSNLRSIFLRTDFGEGYLFNIINKKGMRFDISEAFIMEKTRTLENNSDLDLFTVRMSTRIRFNAMLGNIHVSFISLIQPALKQFFLNDRNKFISVNDNFLSRSTLVAELPVYKNLTFAVTFNYIVETYSNYLSNEQKIKVLTPQPIDYNLQIGLKYKTK